MKSNLNKALRLSTAVGAVLGLFVLAGQNSALAQKEENRGQISSSDYKFAVAASRGGTLEVTLGKLAQDKSNNQAVKDFGGRMVREHDMAGADLMKIATQKGATLPTEPTMLQQHQVERLMKLSGPEFDRAYISYMVSDHKEDLKEFKRASKDVQDPDLKAFAVAKTSMVEDHLKMAQGIEEQLKTTPTP